MQAQDSHSPKQVARALNVSESSVKRWCDNGRIKTSRTGGGHRRIRSVDVVDFIRESGNRLIDPQVLGIEYVDLKSVSVENAVAVSVQALLSGHEQQFQEIITGLFFANYSLSEIFDRVIGPSFHEIGVRWECDDAKIYQERRSCEICLRALRALRALQPERAIRFSAIGGTLSADIYRIPTALAELVLRDQGISATALGTLIPASSYVKAIDELGPDLVWLSVSHIADEVQFLREFEMISTRCVENKIALVVGGRALTDGIRRQVTYSAFCDTMQHLESFAKTLSGSRSRKRLRKTNG